MRIRTLAAANCTYTSTSAAFTLTTGGFNPLPPGTSLPDISAETLLERSPLAEFAMQSGLQELSLSASTTSFTCRAGGSLAVRASSTTSISSRAEHTRFDLTFAAEDLGLGPGFFADPDLPLRLHFEYNRTNSRADYSRTVRKVETLRTPLEIVQDLARGITRILADSRDTTIQYRLDAEALESLLGSDSETAALFNELVMAMAAINLMKRMMQDTENCVITLSGKGAPYLDIQEDSDAETTSETLTFNITILPPAAAAAQEDNPAAEPPASGAPGSDNPAAASAAIESTTMT